MAFLATIIAVTLLGAPAQADDDPDLTVTITALTPSWLKAGSDVTMRGTITNNDDHTWSAVQAYLVIPANPFTTRTQVDEAIATGNTYTGNRVVEPDAFDELGDLAAGQTTSFEVKVPYEQLGISGGAGVYPVGVQMLGTDSDGTRSNEAIARATTFLPRVAPEQKSVPTTVVWPFLMPDYRRGDGNYNNPLRTLETISPGGQLRNLLDLAATLPPRSSTVVIDPALLVGIDDIANDRRIADDVALTESQMATAESFLADLLAYIRAQNMWILDFDRPDALALVRSPELRDALDAAVDTATRSTLSTYQLIGRRVTWPAERGVTASLLASERRDGETPLIVNTAAVPGWERRLGSIVSYSSSQGPVPLLVNDVIPPVPGGSSVVSLRQRILSDAALAGLQRAVDSSSRADAVTIVDPTWNPGPAASTRDLAGAFESPFTVAATLDDLLARPVSKYEGRVPTTTSARSVSKAQVQAAAELASAANSLTSIVVGNQSFQDAYARQIAGVLGVRWRLNPDLGVAAANDQARRAASQLTKVQIEGPPSVTLSSASGGFPLTIINDTTNTIRVGVALDSSNPALNVPSVKPVDVAAGERHTLTVNIDLGGQRTTQLTARLTSPDGSDIGSTAVFNVRSSKIGAVLWVAIGLAGALVVVALFRRFHRRRSTISTVERPFDDD